MTIPDQENLPIAVEPISYKVAEQLVGAGKKFALKNSVPAVKIGYPFSLPDGGMHEAGSWIVKMPNGSIMVLDEAGMDTMFKPARQSKKTKEGV